VTPLDWREVTTHAPRPEPRVELFSAAAAADGAVAADGAEGVEFAGVGGARRARRTLAASLPELGLWGAAAALRYTLAKSAVASPFAPTSGSPHRRDGSPSVDAAMLAAPPQARFASGAPARNGGGGAAAARDDDADADALADDLTAAAGRAAPCDAAPASSGEMHAHAHEHAQYEPRFRRAASVIEATLRRMPPAALAAAADATASAVQPAVPLMPPAATLTPWMSDKVAALLRVLRRYATAPPGWRAIVFCQRKATAHALAALLTHLASGHGSSWAFLRPGAQSGYASGDGGSEREQLAVLQAFRDERRNVLCATSVLEEGVDVPECSLVVLFDLARNVKSFIQARGRARAAASALVVLAPRDGAHEALLAEVSTCEAAMRATAAARAAALAASGGVSDEEEEAAEEALRAGAPGALRAHGPSVYTVHSTGAKVTLAAAVQLVHHYTQKLPHDRYCDYWLPHFHVTSAHDALALPSYECVLTIPGHVWLGSVSSGAQPSKRAAKAAAALAAAARLHAGGALTDRLVPAPLRGAAEDAAALQAEEDAAAGADADAAGDGDAEHVAAERAVLAAGGLRCVAKLPDVLEPLLDASALADDASHAGSLAGRWHVSTLAPHGPQPEADAHPVPLARWALLTRAPLPRLPPLRLASHGRPASQRLEQLGCVDIADVTRERCLRRFLAWAHAAMWGGHPGVGAFAPLAAPLTADGSTLDWALLCACDAPWGDDASPPLADADADAWRADVERMDAPAAAAAAAAACGRVLWTRHAGRGRLYYGLGTRGDVSSATSLTDVPGAPSLAAHYMSRHGVAAAVLDVGPWIEAVAAPAAPRRLIPAALSVTATAMAAAAAAANADAAAAAPKAPGRVLLPAALCVTARCPSSLWRALTLLPSQLWCLRGLLLTRELATHLLPGSCDGDDASHSDAFILAVHEAMTSGAATEDVSYQRFEILGDAFLKYAVGVSLFASLPHAHEGQLSACRAARVSNGALARAARRAGLQRYLRAAPFAPGAAPPPQQPLQPKALADILEALIGAVLHVRGLDAATAVAATLHVLPAPAPPLDAYAASVARLAADAAASAGAPPPRACDDLSLASLTRLEGALGYSFQGRFACKVRAADDAMMR
jgi:hypothetical protein